LLAEQSMLQGSSSAAFQEAKDWALQIVATSEASGDAEAARVQNLAQDAAVLSVPVKAAGQPEPIQLLQMLQDHL